MQELHVEPGELIREDADFASERREAGSLRQKLINSGRQVCEAEFAIGIGSGQGIAEVEPGSRDHLILRVSNHAAQLRLLRQQQRRKQAH